MKHITSMIHEQAHIGDDVTIGRLTRVWQFASVIRRAVVGSECRIASCAIIDGATLGDRVIVSHGAFVCPGVCVADDVFIGPNVTLTNDIWPRSSKGDWFGVAQIIEEGLVITRIESGASVGAGSVVLPGLRVGAGAMIAAGATVERDVPALALYRRDGTMEPINPSRTPDRRRLVTR